MLAIPDLLALTPELRLTEADVARAIAFAFVGGQGDEALEAALTNVKANATSFDPAQFASELFLDELVKRFRVTACGQTFTPSSTHLVQVLSHPPKDPETVAFRRAIALELVRSPSLRVDLERTYVELRLFRDTLTAEAHGSIAVEHQHRIDTLRALRAVIEGLAARFAGAESGLSRMRELGRELTEGDPYASLVSLLDYEGGLATVDVRMRVGADGTVRGFEIMKALENTRSPFYRTPFGRFWTRLSLLLRGYRFGELEVMSRVLDDVFEPFERATMLLIQLTQDCELYLGALGFRDLALARGLAVSLPEMTSRANGPRELHGLFNPLLLSDRASPRPCDVVSPRADAITIVTGPNSGGKTRLLQAIAIAQLLAQNGLFVPARSAKLAWTSGLFVSLHHEISASQREGRLGTELVRIRGLFEDVQPGDLVVVDELCSGTNPSEAEAIIRLVLELLAELHPQVFVTTHFLEFASELSADPPIARLEFLQAALDERHRPTYAFVKGVAATSLAAETAARLGVTLEELAGLVARKQKRGEERELPEELGRGDALTE